VDAAIAMANATSVIIVPGYGLAAAQAQHAVRETLMTFGAAKEVVSSISEELKEQ
jgi:NAD/NADP transhydrogenase beta subunit